MRLTRAVLLGALAGLSGLPAWPASTGQPLPRTRIEDVAAAALVARQGGPIELRPLDEDGAADLTPPPGAVSLHARVAEGTALARRMVVSVDIHIDRQHWRTVPVWFAVRAWRPVWVARAPLAAGQVTRAEHFVVQQREVAALNALPVPSDRQLDAWRLRRSLERDAVLTVAQVEPLPAVARNQPVRVHVQAGHVELQAAGVALADARIGERVRVLNPASRESFAARVVAAGLVVAEER
jgi:flagella basal body P-ring formation protein FlgA